MPRPITKRIPIAAKMVLPSLPKKRAVKLRESTPLRTVRAVLPACASHLRSRTILPNVITQAPGSSIMEYNSIRLVRIVGFSIGVAEFAPINPPPLVPKCLMISRAATGPCAMICLAPSMVSTIALPLKFCGTPCQTRSKPPMMENGSSTRVVIRTRSE